MSSEGDDDQAVESGKDQEQDEANNRYEEEKPENFEEERKKRFEKFKQEKLEKEKKMKKMREQLKMEQIEKTKKKLAKNPLAADLVSDYEKNLRRVTKQSGSSSNSSLSTSPKAKQSNFFHLIIYNHHKSY